jgi:SPX domain protein involved in polyphosphate accumulation
VFYGLEVKFGIEENVINTVLKFEDYIQCTNELYNDFRDLPYWIIYETENGVRVFTPLGCFMKINLIF